MSDIRIGAALAVCLLTANLAAVAADPPAAQQPVLTAAYPADGGTPTSLGHVDISGLGQVTLFATRNGARLLVNAKAADGSALGRAETVVGLGETPLYVRSNSGLQRITVHWMAGPKAPEVTRPTPAK
jgi:hypothetical protein